VEPEEKEVSTSKYVLEKPKDLKSQFLIRQEEKEKRKELATRQAQMLAEQVAIAEFEKPPPDPLASKYRISCMNLYKKTHQNFFRLVIVTTFCILTELSSWIRPNEVVLSGCSKQSRINCQC